MNTLMQKEILTPVAFGVGATLAMLALYFLVLSGFSGWEFAQLQFRAYWYFILTLSFGFGVQIGLYQYIKFLVREGRGMGVGMGKMVGASGATSAMAMISCCAHYLANLLPVLGVTGLMTFLTQYQVNFFWAGILFNIGGIIYMVKRISIIIKKS